MNKNDNQSIKKVQIQEESKDDKPIYLGILLEDTEKIKAWAQ